MKLPTTSFQKLHGAGACVSRYRHLAKALGGIKKYGRDTPITLVQVLDICGLHDLAWMAGHAFYLSHKTLYKKILDANRRPTHAWLKVWHRGRDSRWADAEAAEAAEMKKQLARIRKYLIGGKV